MPQPPGPNALLRMRRYRISGRYRRPSAGDEESQPGARARVRRRGRNEGRTGLDLDLGLLERAHEDVGLLARERHSRQAVIARRPVDLGPGRDGRERLGAADRLRRAHGRARREGVDRCQRAGRLRWCCCGGRSCLRGGRLARGERGGRRGRARGCSCGGSRRGTLCGQTAVCGCRGGRCCCCGSGGCGGRRGRGGGGARARGVGGALDGGGGGGAAVAGRVLHERAG